jgi:hypothetical protein
MEHVPLCPVYYREALMGRAHAEDRSTHSGEPKAWWRLMHPSWARDHPPCPRALGG